MSQDYVALEWVKGELDETLQQAQQSLEAYVDNPQDAVRLNFCLNYLHQVHGTLKIVEFYGAALLAEEMEDLAEAIRDKEVGNESEALEVLMRAIIQLPSYLDHIKVGRRDLPAALLPILNELRSARGKALMSEGGLFSPDLLEVTFLSPQKLSAFNDPGFSPWLKKLRQMLQTSMLHIIKGQQLILAYDYLEKVFARLHKNLGSTPHGAVWLPALGFVAALRELDEIPPAAKPLLRQLDVHLKHLLDTDISVLNEKTDEDFIKNLLFYVAHCQKNSGLVGQVKKQYKLTTLEETQAEDILSRPDKETVGTVVSVLIEEISEVKDQYDLLVRGNYDRITGIKDSFPALEKISNTMKLLNLGMPLQVLLEQVNNLRQYIEQGSVSDEQLMDLAGALLYVEATLIGMQIDGSFDAAPPEEASISDAQMAVLREARNVIEQVKDAVVEYIGKQWSVDEIDDVPLWLKAIEGSLSMIPLPRVADIISKLSGYVQLELINGQKHPHWSEMDQFADILTGIEYFLERYINSSSEADEALLDRAEASLENLISVDLLVEDQTDEEILAEIDIDVVGQDQSENLEEIEVSVLDDVLSAEEDTGQAIESLSELIDQDSGEEIDLDASEHNQVDESVTVENLLAEVQEMAEGTPVEQDIYEQMAEDMQEGESPEEPISDVPTVSEVAEIEEDDDDLIDDEIIEIFLEEAEEVLETINEYWPQYKSDLNHDEARTTVRRSFHTLKGSGRMVQANIVGELAWAIENMLNRVIDETIIMDQNIVTLIDHVITILPDLVEDFKLRRKSTHDTQSLNDYAAAISRGESVEEFASAFAADASETDAAIEEVTADVELSELNDSLSDIEDEDDEILDDALLEIFETETSSHISNIQSFIDESRDSEFSNVISDQLQRSLHTLKGSAHMAGITPIANVASPLERLVKELRVYQVKNAPGLVSVLEDGLLLISQGVDQLRTTPTKDLEQASEFLSQLSELEKLLLAPVNESSEKVGPDPQQLSELLMNGMDALLEADASIKDWAEIPSNTAVLMTLVAELNELEDGALSAEIPELAGLAKAVSTLYQSIIYSPPETVSEDFIALSHSAHEGLLAMLDSLAAGQNVVSENGLVVELNNWDFDDAEASLVEVNSEQETDLTDVVEEFIEELPEIEEIQIEAEDEENPANIPALPEVNEDGIVDDELVAIFIEEAEEITESSMSLLASWREKPENLVNVAELQRELHTLKGGARMAEVPAVANLCHELENIYELVHLGKMSATNEMFDLLDEAHDALDDLIDQLKKNHIPKNPEALIARLEAFINGTSDSPSDASADIEESTSSVEVKEKTRAQISALELDIDLDPDTLDVIEIFMDEAQELLAELDAALHQWEQNPHDQSQSAEIQRIMHTLKGGARLANLTAIGDECHDFESWLIRLQLDAVETDAEFFAEAYRRQDLISNQIDQVTQYIHGGGEESAEVIEESSEQEVIPETPDVSDAVPSEESVEEDSNVVPFKRDVAPVEIEQDDTTNITPIKKQVKKPKAKTEAVKKAPQELVKVPANLLDGLVNLAGETSISRGRLEQQVNDFSYSLTEMDVTLDRLRDQLRRLDMETEAQVLFRQERQGPNYDDFDPLEMDRYSQMQQLARSLMESASDLLDIKDTLSNKTRDAETLLLQQSRVNTELQEGLMQTRMVPFQRLVPRLRRIVRQISLELSKNVEFHVFNADGEMDRSILERLVTPLEHMLRNAVDHGLEIESDRTAKGKPQQGNIELHISREGSDVVVRLKDDGRGFNVSAIRAKAVERGLITEDAELTNHDILQLILSAGFSTAEHVTQISGRGVGMDIVNSEIKQMGGSLAVNSEPDMGTEFVIRLPFTVSVNRALMIKLGDDLYAVPLDSIKGIVRIPAPQLSALYEKPPEERVYHYGGEDYPINYLGDMLHSDAQPKLANQNLPIPVLLVQGEVPYALQVDTLLGSREIVVKTLGSQFSSVVGVSGGTILGDGSVVIILDLPSMMRRQTSLEYQQAIALDSKQAEQRSRLEERRKRILVVDDSVTVRKVTGRLLERNGFEVFTAKDGVDAVEVLQDHIPDLMLLDIEMPRMDGFEVASIVRHDKRLKDIPIIMITSRTGEKHKNRALSIGVNRYLGKPFQEDILLSTMAELLIPTEV